MTVDFCWVIVPKNSEHFQIHSHDTDYTQIHLKSFLQLIPVPLRRVLRRVNNIAFHKLYGKAFCRGSIYRAPFKALKQDMCLPYLTEHSAHSFETFHFTSPSGKTFEFSKSPIQWSLLFYLVSAPFIVPDKSKKRESGKKAYLLISAAHYSHLVKK